MKKLLALLAILIVLPSAFALNSSPMRSDYGAGYWHANDYYNVELSGNGNAFIVATINLESLSSKNITSITLEIPNTNVQIYKLVQNGGYYYPCNFRPCPAGGSNYPIYYEPQFLNYSVEKLAESTVLHVDLEYPLMPTQQNTIYLVYSTPRIAKQTFEGFEFTFKTVQDPNSLIRSVSASVSVPQDMILKGQPNFNINYQTPSVMSALTSGSAKEFVNSVASIRYSGPYYGGQQYSAQNLLPGESFTVTGLYGSNFWLLYLQEILWGIIVLLAVLFLFYFFLMRRVRKVFERRFEGGEIRRKSSFSFGRALTTGIISGFFFVVAYFVLTYFSGAISAGPYYGYQPATQILFFLLNAAVLMLSLFGLPYWLGQKNRSEGIIAGIIGIFTALVLLVVISMVFPSQPPIVYYAGGMMEKAINSISGSSPATAPTQSTTVTPQ